jgi:O-antigen/teichoic acid export membrane protein
VLLLVGGAATTATALALGMIAFGRALLRSRRALRSIRWAAFLGAMAILLVGILDHVPRRDPYLVLAAASALTVAALARRLERRRAPRPFSPSPEASMEKRPNLGR